MTQWDLRYKVQAENDIIADTKILEPDRYPHFYNVIIFAFFTNLGKQGKGI